MRFLWIRAVDNVHERNRVAPGSVPVRTDFIRSEGTEMTDPASDTAAASFEGWPPDATTFLAELAADNSRAFWTANVERYRTAVLAPTQALMAVLSPEFGPGRVFRPYVDRRFRPNAEPYRTDAGALVTGHGGTPYVVVLAAGGLSVQVGYQVFDAGQLRRYRAAIDTAAGDKLDAVFAGLREEGLAPADVPALTGRPRGCPADHPRLHLLRLRGLHVDRTWPAGAWLQTGDALVRVRVAWRAAEPLADWLDANVGPREA